MQNTQSDNKSSNKKGLLLLLLLLFITSASLFLLASLDETEQVNIILDSAELKIGDQGEIGFTSSQEELKWSSNNTNIVTVNQQGVMTGVGAGTATISVKLSSGELDTIAITVTSPLEPSFTITIDGNLTTYKAPVLVSSLTPLEREGYRFEGWYTNEALTAPITQEVIEGSITLFPKYEALVTEPETVILTLVNEQGNTIETIEVIQGQAFDFERVSVEENFVGFYENPTTCESSAFDQETLIIEDTTLTLVYNDQTSPCIMLETIRIKGDLEMGETLEVFYDPITDDVSFKWYRLEEGIFTEIPNETRKFYTITEDDEDTALKVEVIASGDINGTLSFTTETIQARPVVTLDYDLIYDTICDENITLDMIYPVGAGTESNPYLITNWYQLDLLRYVNKIDDSMNHFRINQDLNSSTLGYAEVASETVNLNLGFMPIMNETCNEDRPTPFTGIVYAVNVTISDVFIDDSSLDYVGLFGQIDSNSQLIGFTLDAFNITGKNYVGTLVGKMENSLVDDITVTNSVVNGEERVGGIIGRLIESTVNNVSFNGSVYGRLYVGGIAGSTNIAPDAFDPANPIGNASISSSQNSGSIYGQFSVGGIVGGNGLNSNISHVTNTGTIRYNDQISEIDEDVFGILSHGAQFGGLVGGNSGLIEYGYSSGDVLAFISTGKNTTKIGGAIGAIGLRGSASNITVEANVSGSHLVAGIVGFLGGPIEYVYYKGDVTGIGDASGIAGFILNFTDFGYFGTVNNAAVLPSSTITANHFANGFAMVYASEQTSTMNAISIEADIISQMENAIGFVNEIDGVEVRDVYINATLTANQGETFLISYNSDDSVFENWVISINNGTHSAVLFNLFGYSNLTHTFIDGTHYVSEDFDSNSSYGGSTINYSVKNRIDLIKESTYSSFDFINVWNIEENQSLPWLKFLENVNYVPRVIAIP